MVLPAPIKDIAWDGNKVTARALIPGQEPMLISGVVDEETGAIEISMGGGSMVGAAAEDAQLTVLPNA